MTADAPDDPLRVLVADDEEPARRRLETMLGAIPGVVVVGSVGDGEEAARALAEIDTDLALLDVQMPGLDGFEVLEEIGQDRPPAVAFVTAYDEHAVRAFRERAVDYLLKPVDRDRIREVLARTRELTARDRREELEEALDAVRSLASSRPGRFLARRGDREVVVDAADVRWIEAAGNYARLHTGDDAFLVRRTLADLEDELDPGRFRRIHRSRIVDLDRVRQLRPLDSGDAHLILEDGTELRMSRRYAADVRRALGDS